MSNKLLMNVVSVIESNLCTVLSIMIRRPPISTRTDTRCPYTTLFRSVPQTSSQAICAAILPWVNKLASGPAWRDNEALVRGINVELGELLRQILRSEEHTSELQSLMRISYAVFCLTK